MTQLILISILALIIFVACYRAITRPKEFIFDYSAKTKYASQDHTYKFRVKKVDSDYRCYIERTPSFRGRTTDNYLPHYWIENATGNHYVCWTGTIKYPEQAKTLCRNWADATQIFIDTGVPIPEFRKHSYF